MRKSTIIIGILAITIVSSAQSSKIKYGESEQSKKTILNDPITEWSAQFAELVDLDSIAENGVFIDYSSKARGKAWVLHTNDTLSVRWKYKIIQFGYEYLNFKVDSITVDSTSPVFQYEKTIIHLSSHDGRLKEMAKATMWYDKKRYRLYIYDDELLLYFQGTTYSED